MLSNGSEVYELNVTAVVLQESFVSNPLATLYVGSSAVQTLSCNAELCNASNYNLSVYEYNWPMCSLCVATAVISPALDGASLWYTFQGNVSGTTFNVSSNSTLFNYTAAFLSKHYSDFGNHL